MAPSWRRDMDSPLSTPAGPAWTRTALELALAWALPLAALAAWAAWSLAQVSPIGTFSDSIDYLVLSDFYARYFHGEAAGETSAYFSQSRFPPLFPLVLAAAGAVPLNEFPAHVVTQLLAIAAMLAFVAWFLLETHRIAVASLLGLAAFVAAGQIHLLLNPVSEPLMMVLLGSTLLLSARVRASESSLLVLAALVGLVPMARMAGAALVAAFALWLWCNSAVSTRRRLAALSVATLPMAAWLVYRSLLPIEESYVAALSLERATAAFGGWSGFLHQPAWMLRGLASAFGPNPGLLSLSVACVMAILATVALPERMRANKLDAWFTPIYAGLVLVWPYPAETGRLLLVLAPVLMLQAWSGATLLAAWTRERAPVARALPAVALLLLVGACVPAWSTTIHRARLVRDPVLAPYIRTPAYFAAESDSLAVANAESWARIVALAAELPDVVPGGDCVYSLFPGMTWFLSGRQTRVEEIPLEVSDAGTSLGELRACRYVIAVNLHGTRHGMPALFPLEALGARAVPVLHSEFMHDGRRVIAAVLLDLGAPAR